MSLFGQLDAANIPSNPFFVAEGIYEAEVTKGEYSTSKTGNRQLHIEYTINNEDSQYLDSKLHHYFTLVDADMTAEKFALLPTEEQQKLRKSNSKIKQVLCGNDANSTQNGLGVDPEDLNDKNWDPKSLLGIPVEISVANNGEKNEYTNIKWVNKVNKD